MAKMGYKGGFLIIITYMSWDDFLQAQIRINDKKRFAFGIPLNL